MKNSFWASPALTLGLTFCAPIFFVFSQNWHMVDPLAMLLSSGIVFLMGCFLALCAGMIIRLWKKIASPLPRWLHLFVTAAFCLLLVAIACFLLQITIQAAIPDPRWLRNFVTRFLPFIFLLLVIRKFGFSPINIFLTIFLGLSIVNIGVLLATEDQDEMSILPAAYALQKRPSIYLFFLESYHSLDIQREVYGIDTSEFERYLAQNGFVDYGKIYANSPHTLASLADTFSFFSSERYVRGNSDAAYSLRKLLGGDSQNTLFRILKQNDYRTIFLVGESGYYGSIKGEFLDESDCLLPPSHRTTTVLCDVVTCFEMLNTRLQKHAVFGLRKYRKYFRKSLENEFHYTGSLEDRISQVLATPLHLTPPLFLTFQGGAEHTPANGTYTWQQHTDWVQSGLYQERIDDSTQELKRICDKIIAHDPDSILILIGDHGAARFRGAEQRQWASSSDNLIDVVEAKNIPFQDFVDDRHGVFLAIRLPHGQRENISHGLPLSHVNLFRHVFAYLNNDKRILETREPSNSHLRGNILVREGTVATKQ